MNRWQNKCKRSELSSGFTLIELVLVIVILTLLASMFVRPLNNAFALESRLNIQSIESAFQYARYLSLQSGCIIAIEFSEADEHQRQSLQLIFENQHCFAGQRDNLVSHPGTLGPYIVDLDDFPDIRWVSGGKFTHSWQAAGQTAGKKIAFYSNGSACNQEGVGVVLIRFGETEAVNSAQQAARDGYGSNNEAQAQQSVELRLNCQTGYLQMSV